MVYRVPREELQFILVHLLDHSRMFSLAHYSEMSSALFIDILEQSARFIEQKSPL